MSQEDETGLEWREDMIEKQFGQFYDQQKAKSKTGGLEEAGSDFIVREGRPYRYLNNWYIDHSLGSKVPGYAASSYKSSRKRRFPLPEGNKFGIFDQLHGILEPRDSGDKPIRIVINKLNIWTLDCSIQSRGFWVESSNAWYRLKYPCTAGIPISVQLKEEPDKIEAILPSQADLHLPLRAKFGLLSNIIDILSEEFAGEPFYYLNLHACRTPIETFQILSTELAKPFDIELLNYSAGFIRRNLINFHSNLTTDCYFIKGLIRMENEYLNIHSNFKWTKDRYKDSAEQAEKRANRTSFGDLQSLEKISPNKKLELDISSTINKNIHKGVQIEDEMNASKETLKGDENDQLETRLKTIANKSRTYSSEYYSEARNSLLEYFTSESGIDQSKIQEFISNVIVKSSVPSFEYLLVCIELLRISSKKVLKTLFKKSAEGGRSIFIHWFNLAFEEIVGVSGIERAPIIDNLAAVKVVREIMLLICDFSVIKEAKQLEVLKNKFGVDWIGIVQKTIEFEKGKVTPNLSSSTKEALQHLEFITGQNLQITNESSQQHKQVSNASSASPKHESPEELEERLRRQRINKMKEKAQGSKKKDINEYDAHRFDRISVNGEKKLLHQRREQESKDFVRSDQLLNTNKNTESTVHTKKTSESSYFEERRAKRNTWSNKKVETRENNENMDKSVFSGKKRSVPDCDNTNHKNDFRNLHQISDEKGTDLERTKMKSSEGWNSRTLNQKCSNSTDQWRNASKSGESLQSGTIKNESSQYGSTEYRRSDEANREKYTRSPPVPSTGRRSYEEDNDVEENRLAKRRRENNESRGMSWQNRNKWRDNKHTNDMSGHEGNLDSRHEWGRNPSISTSIHKSYKADHSLPNSRLDTHNRDEKLHEGQWNTRNHKQTVQSRGQDRNLYKEKKEFKSDDRDRDGDRYRQEKKYQSDRYNTGWGDSSESGQRGWDPKKNNTVSRERDSRDNYGWNQERNKNKPHPEDGNRNGWKRQGRENITHLQGHRANNKLSNLHQPQENKLSKEKNTEAPKSVSHIPAASFGRGRGRDRNLPAWMTSGNLSQQANKQSLGDSSKVPRSIELKTVHVSPPISSHREQHKISNSQLSNTTPMGRGRGKNLPAWMTSGKIPQDVIRKQVEVTEENRRNEPSMLSKPIPLQQSQKPYEQTKSKSKKQQKGSKPLIRHLEANKKTSVHNTFSVSTDRDAGHGRGRGRGRHVNLPAWMTANKN